MKIKQVEKNGRLQWRVAWVREGKQRRRFFATKGKAEAFGKTVKPTEPAFAMFSILSAADQLDAVEAVKMARRKGHSALEAVRFFQNQQSNLIEAVLLPKAWGEYYELKSKVQEVRESSLKNMRSQVGRFVDEHKRVYVGEVDADHLLRWMVRHEWGAESKNSFLRCMKAFLGWCVERGYANSVATSAIPMAITPERSVSILTVAEASRLMKTVLAHDKKLAPYVAAGLFAGVRPTELLRLRKGDIRKGTINLTGQHTKTRRARIVHLMPNAKAWLALEGDWPPVNLRRRMVAIRTKAKFKTWPADVLRHSFASYYLALKGLADCALESGNSEEVLLKHYRHPVTKAQARKFFAIRPR